MSGLQPAEISAINGIGGNNLMLDLFRLPGNEINIVAGENCRVYGATQIKMTSHWNKLTYFNWLCAQAAQSRQPDEINEKSGQISSGTVTLTFEDKKWGIVAYEIFISHGDNVSAGALNFTHTFDDREGASKIFRFSVQPQKTCRVLYLAVEGQGSKYIPAVHNGQELVPVKSSAASTANEGEIEVRDNEFVIAGPDDVRVSILPVAEFSESLALLMQNAAQIYRAAGL